MLKSHGGLTSRVLGKNTCCLVFLFSYDNLVGCRILRAQDHVSLLGGEPPGAVSMSDLHWSSNIVEADWHHSISADIGRYYLHVTVIQLNYL